MSITLDSNIDIIVAEWEAKIYSQKNRQIKTRTPEDIAVIIRRYHEYDTGYRKLVGAFPIFYKDTIEEILKKYCHTFRDEAYEFVEDMKRQKKTLHNNNGMSKGKQFRLAMELPNNLNAILSMYSQKILKAPFPSEWWYKKIKEAMPICFVGSM